MASRSVRRIARGCLLLAALLGVTFLIACWQLPSFLEHHAIAHLSERGLRDSEIRVTTVGFHAIDLADFCAFSDTWQIEFDSGHADYRPQDLLNGRIESLALDGLRLEWGRPSGASTPSPTPSQEAPFPAQLPSHLPFRQLTLSNATLIIRGEHHDRTLPFAAQLVADQRPGSFAARLLAHSPEDRIQVLGRFAPSGDSRLSATFQLRNPSAWLGIWGGMPILDASDPVQWDPWVGALEIHRPLDPNEVLVTASINPLRVTWGGNRLTTADLTAEARGLPYAPRRVRLASGLDWTSPSGLHVSAPNLTLDLADLTRLETRARDLQIQHPGILEAKGGFLLVVDEVAKGAEAAFGLTFQCAEATLPSFSLEPFQGELVGNRTRLELTIPELTALFAGRWRLSGIAGQFVDPWTAHATLTLRGFLDGARSGALTVVEPLPFAIHARRQPDGATASIKVPIHGVVIPALSAPTAAHLGGSIQLTAELEGNHSRFCAQLGLDMPELHFSGVRIHHAVASGGITLRSKVSPSPSAPRWLLRLLEGWPVSSLDPLECSNLDLRLGASAIRSSTGLVLTDPFFKLSCNAAGPSDEASPVSFDFGVARTEWNGIEWVDLVGSGSLDEHGACLNGSALWLGGTLPFHIRIVPETIPDGEQRAIGHFTFGPWRAVNTPLPKQLATGEDITVEGQASMEGQLSFGSRSALELLALLRLELAQLDWPGKNISLKNARALVAVSGPGPWRAHTPEGILVERLDLAGQELTELVSHVELEMLKHARFDLTQARWLGGRLQIEPFTWDWDTGDLNSELQIQGLDLQALSRQLPRFAGKLEGQVNGRIPMARAAGQWQIPGGRLELDRQSPARLQYPAEGLLTSSLRPGSPRYQQLRLVEDGLKDLRLQELTLDLNTNPGPEPVVRVRVEGLSRSPHATVPIILNLNLRGATDEIRRLLETGRVGLSR